ncbi:MAG TPA: ABC transporter ATP-binding protein [Pyrinomonadaceae bacterium]|nr:ABC transporter ATP-binding protein [Pyrinomonadaceae bacterium]
MIIEVERLTKDYGGVHALKGVSFCVEAGGVIGLLGPNGAGKTTLVETIEGLRTPTSGRVSVLGLDPVRQSSALKEQIGVQLQATALPLELTAAETVRLYGSFFCKSLAPAEALEAVGLEGQARQRNSRLSGGQRQRLAIALALVNDPRLIILDEPTAGLDPVARREIHARIADMRKSNRTVLFSTHYIEEAEGLCDRVIILRAGEMVADGSPFDLLARASGTSTLWISVEGELDPRPLLAAGASDRGREGEYHRFATPDPRAAILALAELLRDSRVNLLDLRMKRPNLEDVYVELTGETTDVLREET